MEIQLSEAMLAALRQAKHIPPDVEKRIAAVKPEPGVKPARYRFHVTEDEGMELAELLQWHVRTDPGTGQPTAETQPYADLIALITEAGL